MRRRRAGASTRGDDPATRALATGDVSSCEGFQRPGCAPISQRWPGWSKRRTAARQGACRPRPGFSSVQTWRSPRAVSRSSSAWRRCPPESTAARGTWPWRPRQRRRARDLDRAQARSARVPADRVERAECPVHDACAQDRWGRAQLAHVPCQAMGCPDPKPDAIRAVAACGRCRETAAEVPRFVEAVAHGVPPHVFAVSIRRELPTGFGGDAETEAVSATWLRAVRRHGHRP